MTREQELVVGEHIRQLATSVCSSLKCPWSSIVFTVAYRQGKTSARFTDVFYIKTDEEDDYVNAYSEEGHALIHMGNLRKIADAYRNLYEVCKRFGSQWAQYTIHIDRRGHFESFFDFPQQFKGSDPFDRKNMERWEMRFLYSE